MPDEADAKTILTASPWTTGGHHFCDDDYSAIQ